MRLCDDYVRELNENNGFLLHDLDFFCIKSDDYYGAHVTDIHRNPTGWKVLNGTRLGRRIRHSKGRPLPRRFEHDYAFAYWAGKRFARIVKASGNKVIKVGITKSREVLGHSSSEKCFFSEFKEGFCHELGSWPEDRNYGVYRGHNGLYVYSMIGACSEKVRVIIQLMSNDAHTDYLQSKIMEAKEQ